MVKKIYYIVFFALLISCTLHKMDTREVIIVNRYGKSIYSFISFNDNIFGDQVYKPLIKSKNDNEIYRKYIFDEIKPGNDGGFRWRPEDWDAYIQAAFDKKLKVFIIQKDSVDKYGWYKINKNQVYNKKYELTIDDLDNQNWEIIYTGD